MNGMSWLKEIKEFKSYLEFHQFVKYLDDRLAEKELNEIEPKVYFHGKSQLGLDEDRWFQANSSLDVWRLVPPDFPFKGLFERVHNPFE